MSDMQAEVVEAPEALAEQLDALRRRGAEVGLVPTMGALHAGHLSLIRRAAAECEAIAVSIFVNPLQFGPNEDLDAYPRRLRADVRAATEAGASCVFAPSRHAMYPDGFSTTLHIAGLTDRLEGAARPGHFDGVTTVVAKLFALVGRSRAYFGEKDFQQLQVVRRLALDMFPAVTVVGCSTVREPDGLALSSRNAYLDPAERAAAAVLHLALEAGATAVRSGAPDAASVRATMAAVLSTEALAAVEYAEVVDPATLDVPRSWAGPLRLLVAARFGRTRLIDNLGVGDRPRMDQAGSRTTTGMTRSPALTS